MQAFNLVVPSWKNRTKVNRCQRQIRKTCLGESSGAVGEEGIVFPAIDNPNPPLDGFNKCWGVIALKRSKLSFSTNPAELKAKQIIPVCPKVCQWLKIFQKNDVWSSSPSSWRSNSQWLALTHQLLSQESQQYHQELLNVTFAKATSWLITALRLLMWCYPTKIQ